MSKSSGDSGETATFQSGERAMPPLEENASLPVIEVAPAPSDAEFQLEETLGQGGMGRVVSARQSALQRLVAVKFLKDEDGDATALMREAIVTGRLEHPNIVPVHVLARSTEGLPFFTMKRVEGTPWSDALRGTSSLLVEHLEVLQRVCDAVSFAHSRGVIHRDIKPANVLIGAFGEVYLVDWGLAAAMRPDTVLPLATAPGMCGTPAYLAPEMATDSRQLGPWTDVFLLGATLYDVLMRRPPWVAASVSETLALAAEAKEPAFDVNVPPELASICRRAMQKAPADRFESAQAFKDAISGYLRHREALELHERTMAKLRELERAAQTPSTQTSLHDLSTQRLFTECRFGFEQVRLSWPQFEPARAGLRRALISMVRHEASRGAPRVARALLAELEQPPAELVAQVDDSERREREQAARLSALEHQMKDSSTEAARAPKSVYARAVAVATLLSSVVSQALDTSGAYRFTTRDGVVFSTLLLVNAVAYSAWLRRQAEANLLQRRIAIGLIGLTAAAAAGWLLTLRYGLDFRFGLVSYFVLNATAWWSGSVTVELRGGWVAGGFALAAVAGVLFPSYVLGSGVLVGLGWWMLSRSLKAQR